MREDSINTVTSFGDSGTIVLFVSMIQVVFTRGRVVELTGTDTGSCRSSAACREG